MGNNEFISLLSKAMANDKIAIYEIIMRYEKLIDKYCYIDGKFDEDCKSYIINKLFDAIPKFKL